jgi:cardiolipin synthase
LAVVLVVWAGIIALVTPTVAYPLDRRFDLGSRAFEDAVSSALATRIVSGNRITRLDNGARFYPEMLAAIAAAHRSIALECYIFHPGQIGDAFTAALVERATAGVHVRIIFDAIGSRRLRRRQARRLTRVGCELAWHPGEMAPCPSADQQHPP